MARKKGRARASQKKQVSPEAAAAKAEAKRQRREERKAREEAEKRRAARRKRNRNFGIGASALVVVVIAGFFVLRPDAEVEGVERPEFRGRDHLETGATFDYGTPTPTSGPHDPRSANCGIVSTQMPLELAVHALEHGTVVVWYQPDMADDLLPGLTPLLDRWDSQLLISPNPGISDPIVATAWNRLKRFDQAGEPLIEFIETYRFRGPERVPCDY